MESNDVISALSALAHPTRLTLFRLLAGVGPEGTAAGHLAEQLSLAASTLSHHLATLERSGLIVHTRQHRNLMYAIQPAAIHGVIAFLIDDCCNGRPDLCGGAREKGP